MSQKRQSHTSKAAVPDMHFFFNLAVKTIPHFDADDKEPYEVRTRTGQQLVAYRTKRQVAAGRTMDIPDLVPKSGDDTAPARSNEEKFLSPIPKVNQLVIRTPSAL
jgi:hypothetical protein